MKVDGGRSLKVMIAGGGTGGHLFLGIALARELMGRDPSVGILFVGTRRGLESQIVPREGFRLEFIVSAGLKRMGAIERVRNFLLIPKSLLQSRRLIRSNRPDVVVGVGGYSSGPVLLAAWWLGRPTLIIEPNAHPGLTNRWLARFIDRAALALPDSGNYFGARGVVTGIPVRREFTEVPHRKGGEGLTVLIYGGSQGSHALNTIVCDELANLKLAGPGLRIIHQTGAKEFDQVLRSYRDAGMEADVQPFLPRIYDQFGEADLIICRAGASTVAELTAAGKASILVPFPGAADDHQTKNAQALAVAGAAKMILEKEWRPGLLASEIRYFMKRPEELRRMENAARKMAKPEAAERIADLVAELGKQVQSPKSEVQEH
jgi:UDP-N-acetylglucosamine--N-acetylmuramyl-(pentapeptide) pyrophosphoryl-undecaprenol N-acetylglucosamine transferase